MSEMKSTKKVGIISLFHNSQNYGGVLQAYALNRAVESMGYSACQVDYCAAPDPKKIRIFAKEYLKNKGIIAMCKKSAYSVWKKSYAKLHGKKLGKAFATRKNVFQQFRDEEIRHTAVCTMENVRQECAQFEALICGSDQIWKPTVVNDVYMLRMAAEGCKKVAYAASLSVDSIPNSCHEKYRSWLSDFDAISVREKNAVVLLQPLCKQKIYWVCDPTLLFNGEDWRKVSATRLCRKPYLFCYFLGEDIAHRRAAQKYAKERHLHIITMPNLQQKARHSDEKFGDIQLYDASAFDFVGLIANAECVFTDSFHAAAFSLNLEKPFFVFERQAVFTMNSRMESLLSLTKCKQRFITESSSSIEDAQIDWEMVRDALDEQRRYSLTYLRNALANDDTMA